MKRFVLFLLFFVFTNTLLSARAVSYKLIENNDKVVYSQINSNWSVESTGEDEFVFQNYFMRVLEAIRFIIKKMGLWDLRLLLIVN